MTRWIHTWIHTTAVFYVAMSLSGFGLSDRLSAQAAPLPAVPIYSAVESAQAISLGGSPTSPWFYQGIVQLAYAGAIVWVIALLQKSGKGGKR